MRLARERAGFLKGRSLALSVGARVLSELLLRARNMKNKYDTELEEMLGAFLDRYPANAKLELKIRGVKERPEYGDKIIKRTYILSVNYDLVMDIDEEYHSSLGKAKKIVGDSP